MPTETRSGRRTNAAGRNLTLAAVLVPALFSLLGWAVSYVYTVVNFDVTMPDWSVNLLNFAAELLPALRDAVLAAFVAILVYAGAGAGRIAAVSGAAVALNAVFGLISTWFSEGFGEFTPMNANFGIVKPLEERVRGGKTARNERLAERSLERLGAFVRAMRDSRN